MDLGIRICTYNVMVPVESPLKTYGQVHRIKRIPRVCADIEQEHSMLLDVVCFQEVMPIRYRRLLQRLMYCHGWTYASQIVAVNDTCRLQSGGLMCVSRHRIVHQAYHTYHASCGIDQLVSKGVLYCQVHINDNHMVHVFNTHLQAWDTKKAKRIRRLQVQELTGFIRRCRIPQNELCVLVGDFNEDLGSRISEYIYKTTGTVRCTNLSTQNSVDPSSNGLVGHDDPSGYRNHEYPDGCYEYLLQHGTCICCAPAALDGVLYMASNKIPTHASSFTYMAKVDPFHSPLNPRTSKDIVDVSDHYPVVATFLLEEYPHTSRNRQCHVVQYVQRKHRVWYVIVCVLSFIIFCVCIKRF